MTGLLGFFLVFGVFLSYTRMSRPQLKGHPMESLIFAFNAIMPIIMLIALGYILSSAGFLTKDFLKTGNKFVFRVALPALLFINVYSIGSFSEIDGSLIIFCVAMILLLFGIGLFVAIILIREPRQKGVVLQCIFRSNFAIIGIPLAETMGGASAKAAAAVLAAVSIPAFNILAVISLSVFAPSEGFEAMSLGDGVSGSF